MIHWWKNFKLCMTNSADFKSLKDHTRLKKANMVAKVNLDRILKLPRHYSSLVVRTMTWLVSVMRRRKILLHLRTASSLLLFKLAKWWEDWMPQQDTVTALMSSFGHSRDWSGRSHVTLLGNHWSGPDSRWSWWAIPRLSTWERTIWRTAFQELVQKNGIVFLTVIVLYLNINLRIPYRVGYWYPNRRILMLACEL